MSKKTLTYHEVAALRQHREECQTCVVQPVVREAIDKILFEHEAPRLVEGCVYQITDERGATHYGRWEPQQDRFVFTTTDVGGLPSAWVPMREVRDVRDVAVPMPQITDELIETTERAFEHGFNWGLTGTRTVKERRRAGVEAVLKYLGYRQEDQ